jgi:hypothetical protein
MVVQARAMVVAAVLVLEVVKVLVVIAVVEALLGIIHLR